VIFWAAKYSWCRCKTGHRRRTVDNIRLTCFLSFCSSRSSGWCADISVLPFQLNAVSFTRDLQPNASPTKRLLLVAFVPRFATGPASGSGAFMRRHWRVCIIFEEESKHVRVRIHYNRDASVSEMIYVFIRLENGER
jgi:hypothetical protein